MSILEELLGPERAAEYRAKLEQREAERQRRLAAGEAVLGERFNFTSHIDSHIDSARVLLDHAKANVQLNRFAKPIAYLQRHCLELLLKDLLDSLYAIEAGSMYLENREGPVRVVPSVHDLIKLHALLKVAIPMISLGVPPEFSSLVEDIAAVEDGDETRWRYETGKKPAYRQRSFTKETTVPVGNWQERLEEIRAKHLYVRMGGQENRPDTLAEIIGYELQGLLEAQHEAGKLTPEDP